MLKRIAIACFLLFACLALDLSSPDPAQAAELILPKAAASGGDLMQAMAGRKSHRSFNDKALSEQELSNVLWSAWGVNRPGGNKRTVPTSMNKQNVRLFAVLQSGVWEYDGAAQKLTQVLEGDMRSKYGGAPLTLLYAAEDGYYASGMHVGSMYQNVGLYCAYAGLGNVVKRSGIEALEGQLPLPPEYRVFIVQSIGYPD